MVKKRHLFACNRLRADEFQDMVMYSWGKAEYNIEKKNTKFNNLMATVFNIGLETCFSVVVVIDIVVVSSWNIYMLRCFITILAMQTADSEYSASTEG